MTRKIFGTLDIYLDKSSRAAAMNMALDEALLDMADVSSIRFYRWTVPALSFGYFGKFAAVAQFAPTHDLVRRWTGGGIVFHGDDLTYSIIVPANDPVFAEPSTSIYAAIHKALRDALVANGARVELAAMGSDAAQRAVPTNICFANPVLADVLLDGRKVAGAAHRRTRTGLLHQGSIQNVDLTDDFAGRFANRLAENCKRRELNGAILSRACEIAGQKYETEVWLRKR